MIRNRIFLKSLAIFLIIEVVASTVWPTVSYALTSGPTAPEATSFEPVDTTDMVNLATGDLAYNIPLLEVPGPAGGYPLSLSYHAGIMPDEEASWVGLGWTLNPGAINRSVNGFADDHLNSLNVDRLFWEGGSRSTLDIGVTMGISGVVGASASLSVSHDTYQGMGVGGSVGITIGLRGTPGSVNMSVGVDPYGNPFASMGLGVGIGLSEKNSMGLSLGVGLSTNFKSVSGYGSAGVSVGYDKPDESSSGGSVQASGGGQKDNFLNSGSVSLLGASMSTRKGGSAVLSIGGQSRVSNSKVGKVSTSSSGFTLPLPFVNLGFSYQRYWIDETEKVSVFGSLYNPMTGGIPIDDKIAFDSYTLLDPERNLVDYPDPDKVMGGSFLNYDLYSVNAQGISGTVRPYLYKALVYHQNRKKGSSYELRQYRYYSLVPRSAMEFRFVGDFSNKYINPGGRFEHDTFLNDPMVPSYEAMEQTGEAERDLAGNMIGHLYGSRHIEWYTNKQILKLDNTKNPAGEGFMDCRATGFVRSASSTLGDQIGGFKITNESGVTYHFALPAYTHSEYQRSTNIKRSDGLTFNELTKKDPYAYVWYLTGITGPDYVDRGPGGVPDGIFNEEDWGYWVEFEYGKWTDSYAWRNPSEGMDKDLDRNFKNFSEGLKELYYLDAIRTATHTAFFVKSIRDDAKSTIYAYRDVKGNADTDSKVLKLASATKEGGFISTEVENTCLIEYFNFDDFEIDPKDKGSIIYYSRPVSSLKLDSVFLVENSRLTNIAISKSNGIQYSQNYSYSWDVDVNRSSPGDLECDFSTLNINQHFYQNVLDWYDLQTLSTSLRSVSTRVIAMETSTSSLVPETDNSFELSYVNAAIPQTNEAVIPRKSKLTLEAVHFLGKGGADLMPPMRFGYELQNPKSGTGMFTKPMGYAEKEIQLSQSNSGLNAGDVIRINSQDKTCYAIVVSVSGGSHKLQVLGKHTPNMGIPSNWIQTKNAPYQGEYTDIWGMYKADYLPRESDEAIDHLVTDLSRKNVDVWSLRSVKTNLGSEIQIEYESDEYDQSAVNFSNILRVDSIYKEASNDHIIIVADQIPFLDQIIGEDDHVQCLMLIGHPYKIVWHNQFYPDERAFLPRVTEVTCLVKNVVWDGTRWKINVGQSLVGELTTRGINVGSDFTTTYYEPSLIAGNLTLSGSKYFGGGIRVKSVSVESTAGLSSTIYSYESGVTSYEPQGLDQADFTFPSNSFYESSSKKDKAKKAYERKLFAKFTDLLINSREIPPPGVIYGSVKVEEKVNGQWTPNFSKYEFATFEYDDVSVQTLSEDSVEHPNELNVDGVNIKRTMHRDLAVRDMTSYVGSLKSIVLYDRNTGSKISETRNQYSYEAVKDLPINDKVNTLNSVALAQGVIQETFFDARFAKEKDGSKSLMGVVTRRHYYPNVQVNQTITDYKTGLVTVNRNLEYDFYSGAVTKSVSQDGFGNAFVTETTPAYKIYPVMGLKGKGGFNMLTQEAISYTYKGFLNRALVTASAQSWSNQLPVFSHAGELAPITLTEIVPVTTLTTRSYIARSAFSQNYLRMGDFIKFDTDGGTHIARIISSKLTSDGQAQREYELLIVGNTLTITSPATGVTAQRILVSKKHASFSYIGDDNVPLNADGLHALSNDQLPAFTAWNPGDPTPAGWQKNAEITLYDVYSHALEASDLNGQFAATKMTPDQTRVSATVANARYNEFTYSGAEEGATGSSLGNGVTLGTGATLSTSTAHSGSGAVKSSNQGFFTEADVTPGKKYTVSVWASKSSATLKWVDGTGTTGTDVVLQLKRRAGNWYLLSGTIQPTQTHMKVWSQANGEETHFDDFRFHPFDAAMMSYVYNSWGELSHILDNNNLYTEYRYDAMGRLTSTYKETFMTPQEQARYGNNGIVKVSEVNYNYGANSPFMLPLTFTKSGSTGDIVYTGLPQVQQRKSFTFEIKENCSTPKFASLMIDNQLINTAISTHTLLDGTIVKVNGKVVTLENVISPHTIYVTFNDFSNTGRAACFVVPRINEFGNTVYCRDGSFEYWYYNGCGEEQQRIRVYNISQVPAELRGYLPAEGCTVESGTNCVGNLDQ